MHRNKVKVESSKKEWNDLCIHHLEWVIFRKIWAIRYFKYTKDSWSLVTRMRTILLKKNLGAFLVNKKTDFANPKTCSFKWIDWRSYLSRKTLLEQIIIKQETVSTMYYLKLKIEITLNYILWCRIHLKNVFLVIFGIQEKPGFCVHAETR